MMNQDLEKAVELRAQGNSGAALAILQALLEEDASNTMLNYQCAWTLDSLGRETEAARHYEIALAQDGLKRDERRSAILGLGSTYRCLGKFDESERLLRQGMREFPDGREFSTFLALTL